MAKFDWDTRRRELWTVPGTDATYTLIEMSGLEIHRLADVDDGERFERLIRGTLHDQTGARVLRDDDDAAEFFAKLGREGFQSLARAVNRVHAFDLGNSDASVGD